MKPVEEEGTAVYKAGVDMLEEDMLVHILVVVVEADKQKVDMALAHMWHMARAHKGEHKDYMLAAVPSACKVVQMEKNMH